MPFDKTKNQRKGFCFITFESEQVVNELLKTPKQTIKDKEVSKDLFFFFGIFQFFNDDTNSPVLLLISFEDAFGP